MQKMIWNEAIKYIKKNKDIIFLCFTTTWCGDCHMMKPIIESVEQQFLDHPEISFIEVDAEQANLFRTNDQVFKVDRVPTHVFIKNGEIKEIMYEYVSEDIIISTIDKLRYEK